MKPSELLGVAATLRSCGLPTFPVYLRDAGHKIDKVPATDHGFKDATLDEHTLEQMLLQAETLRPDGQELALGTVPGAGGYVVLDCDVKNGAGGLQELERLEALYGDLRVAWYKSASGGVNVVLRKTERSQAIGQGSVWTDIDIRADSGFIVPPGITSSWGDWMWKAGGWDSAPTTPTELWAALPRPAASVPPL